MISPSDFSAPLATVPTGTDRTDRQARSRQAALHDAELVRRFNAGDDAAFDEIMIRHRERLFSVAFAMLRNRADAEEITQDAFLRAHCGLARFRGDASLATWLHRITLNLARNRYWYFFRRRRQDTVSFDRTLNDHSPTTIADLVATDAPDPAREAMTGEFSEVVTACMARLGTRAREILTLRNSLNHSYDEISRELGISPGTVKSRIARARESLRQLISEACPEFGPSAQPAAWFDAIRPAGEVTVICA